MMPIKHLIKYSTCIRDSFNTRFSHCLVCGVEIRSTLGEVVMCWPCWDKVPPGLQDAAHILCRTMSDGEVVTIGSLKEE